MLRAAPALLGAAALLLAAPVAGGARHAVRGSVLVSPQAPVVGKRATIDVRTAKPVKRLALELVSPTGVNMRARLHRVAPRLWRGVFHFPDDGQWLLRTRPWLAAGSVWVQQPPAPLPPFRPAPGKPKAAFSGILGQGTFVLP